MYFNVSCPHCGKTLRARQEHIGRKVGCPHCRGAVVIAPPENESDSEFDSAVAAPSTPALAELASAVGKPPAGQKPAARNRKSRPTTSRQPSVSVGTGAPMLWTALLGLGLTLLFYALLLPLPQGSYLRQLFWERQWVPFVEAYLFFWSVAILLFKWQQVRLQQEATLFDLLPSDVAPEITIEVLPKFVDYLRTLPARTHKSFLLNRVLRGLEHFRVRRNASEVATILDSQGEIDATAVDSSYSLLKVFIWAIPILGFIGTVQGLGNAVSGFSSDLAGAKDISVVKDSLGGITQGLGVAFDTTLIALVMSIVLMFPMSALQKIEDDLLNLVNEYCNENLLKRLNDGGGAEGANDALIRRAIAQAMAGHHAELNLWTKKLEALGSAFTQQAAESWNRMQADALAHESQRLAALSGTAEAMVASQRELLTHVSRLQQQLAELQASQAQQVEIASRSLGSCLNSVQQGLAGLHEVLVRLDGKQVVIEQHVHDAPRRWWFWPGRAGERHE